MGRLRICLLLLIVLTMFNSAIAQESSIPSKGDNQTGNPNVATPLSENWSMVSDIKTGLNPLPPARVQTDDQPEFVREMIRLHWRTDDPIEVWIIRPKVAGKVPPKVPFILYLYGYPDAGERFRDNGWCKRMTADGFAAVGFVAALTDYRFHNRPMKEWFVSQLPEALGSTTHDVQLILNHLAHRGDLDMDRVGVFGMGSGGTIALLAAQADPRIKVVDVLDPWGDWPDWIKKSAAVPEAERKNYLTMEFLHSVTTLDPVSYLPTTATPSIRIQQTLSDPVTPPTAREMIAAAAPLRAVVVKYQSPKDMLNIWKTSGLSGWIKQQMQTQALKSTQAKKE